MPITDRTFERLDLHIHRANGLSYLGVVELLMYGRESQQEPVHREIG